MAEDDLRAVWEAIRRIGTEIAELREDLRILASRANDQDQQIAELYENLPAAEPLERQHRERFEREAEERRARFYVPGVSPGPPPK